MKRFAPLRWLGCSSGLALLLFAVGCEQGDSTSTTKQEPAAEQQSGETQTATDEDTKSKKTDAQAYEIDVPLGLPPVPVPEDNPMTAAKVELGKMLYFDKRLSKDNTISCATCHDPKLAWAEERPTSEGVEGQIGERNSPTVLNTAYLDTLFWDGRAESLEDQATGPIENPIEMGMTMQDAIHKVESIEGYDKQFQQVFGEGPTKENIAKAIAAFERTVLSGNSPYDQFKDGQEDALTDAQKAGMNTFMDAGCSTCHAPPIFSNGNFYNAGIGMDAEEPDPGRMEVTEKESDFGEFRVPPLREVANTAPYFHDGSVESLEESVRIMAGGGIDNENLSMMMKIMREADLGNEDIANLVAFLEALSGEFPVIEPPDLP
jgi:cytochrome c peroxidase